jgi:hypothetical protein
LDLVHTKEAPEEFMSRKGEAGQSPGAGPAVELSGAGGAGAGVEASDAPFLGALRKALVVAPLVVAPAARVRFLFFTIARSEGGLKSSGGGAAVVRKEDEQRRRDARRKRGKGKICPLKL